MPFCTTRLALLTSWATLALASNVCGSVFGLLSIAVTCTYLPPIWLITLAYSFSAPTATIVLLESAAAVDPSGLDEQPAANAAAARPALASTAVARRRGVLAAGMRIDIAGFVSRVVSRRTGRITSLLKTITVMTSVRNSAGGG